MKQIEGVFRSCSSKSVLEYLFNNVAGLKNQKETPTLAFSCESCEIFKNTFFYRTPPVTASEQTQIYLWFIVWRLVN